MLLLLLLLLRLLLPSRFLPDKAIDLVDEAAAKLKMEITSKPEALDEIDRKVLQLEMERLSLQKVGGGLVAHSEVAVAILLGSQRLLWSLHNSEWGCHVVRGSACKRWVGVG
jgi:hypothetical protein